MGVHMQTSALVLSDLRPGLKRPEEYVTGVTIIPPLNSKIRVHGHVMTDDEHSSTLSFALQKANINKLPERFSWLNPQDYKRYHNIDQKIGIQQVPTHQHNCGSCWAIAAAGEFSDRFAIANRLQEEPRFSFSSILSCCNEQTQPKICPNGDQACCGGVLYDAATFICEVGIPKGDCVDDSWVCAHRQDGSIDQCVLCEPSVDVNATCDVLNKNLRPCDNKCHKNCVRTDSKDGKGQLKCDQDGEFKRFKGIKGTPVTIGDPSTNPIQHLQSDIFTYGPIAATFMVYADFLVGSSPEVYDDADGFKKTKGVYVHVEGMHIYHYDQVSFKTCIKCLDDKNLLCDCRCIDNDGKCNRKCSECTDPRGTICDCSCLLPSGECNSKCPIKFVSDKGIAPSRCYLGNHSIVIVGWGYETDVVVEGVLPDGTKVNHTFDKLPYWIVRNSWGPCWMQKYADNLAKNPWGAPSGYFKVAMHHKDVFGPGRGINELLYMDHIGVQINPATGELEKVGGGVSFQVSSSPEEHTATASEVVSALGTGKQLSSQLMYQAYDDSQRLSGSGSSSSPEDADSLPLWIPISIVVIIVLLVGGIIWWSWRATPKTTLPAPTTPVMNVIPNTAPPIPQTVFRPSPSPLQAPLQPQQPPMPIILKPVLPPSITQQPVPQSVLPPPPVVNSPPSVPFGAAKTQTTFPKSILKVKRPPQIP